LLISVATGQHSIGTLTVAELRQILARDLSRINHVSSPTGYIKQFLNIALNVTYEKAVNHLHKHFMFVPDYMLVFLADLQQHKVKAVSFAMRLGFDTAACEDKNRVYFALEYLEQTFMRTFLRYICTHSHISSIVFIHDGIYVQPCPDEVVLHAATNFACSELNISKLSLRIVNLFPHWLDTYRNLFSSSHIDQPCTHVAKRRKYAHTLDYGPPNKRKAAVLSTVEQTGNLFAYFKQKLGSCRIDSTYSIYVKFRLFYYTDNLCFCRLISPSV
jgi:hypothetical protein